MGSISSPLTSTSGTPIYFSGMSTYSQDLQNVISNEIQLASLPIQLLQNNENSLTRQSGELQTLSTKISAVQSAISNLATAAANPLSASISDPSVAQVTMSSSAKAGSYSLEVTNLGSPSTALSPGSLPHISDPSSQNISSFNSFTLTVNGQTTVLTPAGNNLNALADAINASDCFLGKIYDDGSEGASGGGSRGHEKGQRDDEGVCRRGGARFFI